MIEHTESFIKIFNTEAGNIVKGADFPVYGVSDPEEPISNTIIFVKNKFNCDIPVKECIVITKKSLDIDRSNVQIISSNPKKTYADILIQFQNAHPISKKYELNGSVISENAAIGNRTRIGHYCVIEDDVIIGNDCEISDYAYIGAHTRIGNNVVIKEKCSIGISDADIYRDGEGCITLPHLGGTIIEDGCLLLMGAHIAAGDTKATVMQKGSMLGIAANVGHNSRIGKGVIIGAHACVCGHCVIGNNSYVAPSAVIMNRLTIGQNVNIGLGAVVLQNIEDNIRVFGNPAIPTMPLKRLK